MGGKRISEHAREIVAEVIGTGGTWREAADAASIGLTSVGRLCADDDFKARILAVQDRVRAEIVELRTKAIVESHKVGLKMLEDADTPPRVKARLIGVFARLPNLDDSDSRRRALIPSEVRDDLAVVRRNLEASRTEVG